MTWYERLLSPFRAFALLRCTIFMGPPRGQGAAAIWSFRSVPRTRVKWPRAGSRPMVRVEVIAYTPTEFLEEHDITIDRCRELLDTHTVTWVNVVDPDGPTVEALQKVFGLHPLALEDAQNDDLAPKVELYDTTVFIVARTIVWAEELGTDQLSVFVAKKFLITIHDKVFHQLEATRIRLRKVDTRLLKSGADFLAYAILDDFVDT